MRKLVFGGGASRREVKGYAEPAAAEAPPAAAAAADLQHPTPGTAVVRPSSPPAPAAAPSPYTPVPQLGRAQRAESLRSSVVARFRLARADIAAMARSGDDAATADKAAAALWEGALFAARLSLKCLVDSGRIGSDEARGLFADYESARPAPGAPARDILESAAKSPEEWTAFSAVIARMIGQNTKPLRFLRAPLRAPSGFFQACPAVRDVLRYYSCPVIYASASEGLVTLGCRNPAFWVEAAGACGAIMSAAKPQLAPWFTMALLPAALAREVCAAQFGL